MKKYTLCLILLLFYYRPCSAQEIINNPGAGQNKAIQQIRSSDINNIMSLQTLNRSFDNYAMTQQAGNNNNANITQQNDAGTGTGNRLYTVQKGFSNELTLGQIGTGNFLLGFQLGYLSFLTESVNEIRTDVDYNIFAIPDLNAENLNQSEGEGNKLNITQEGDNNGVMAIQQGSYNTLSTEQRGTNNYLSVLQNGTNNSVTSYRQGNDSAQLLFDTIIQIGDNLSLTTDGTAISTPVANRFTQTGSNLSLELNSSLLNTGAGVEINQTGRDMKVVVDQSYFSFPLGKP